MMSLSAIRRIKQTLAVSTSSSKQYLTGRCLFSFSKQELRLSYDATARSHSPKTLSGYTSYGPVHRFAVSHSKLQRPSPFRIIAVVRSKMMRVKLWGAVVVHSTFQSLTSGMCKLDWFRKQVIWFTTLR
jgi:hypothetical protein